MLIKLVAAKTIKEKGLIDPKKVEAWTILQALKWMVDMELDRFILESYCKAVITGSLCSKQHGPSEFYCIIASCNHHLSHYPNFRVSLHIPNCIFETIMNEME
ncbi:hypothetical protein JHK82_026913 [Glycine max]|uniref:RNase H type-1 domain-containing protein n=1 Tax=Glycine max TaxID=3847 RepID=A0A0R0HPA4_SOYBN|nr:hypothetical protein JHK87_026791 [Glycine soja]KAG5126078.1 hypothetical protein JHK82_026913 [Glycine max]